MITVIAFFLALIFLLLVGFAVAAYFAWQKISIFLTWNTRYTSEEYQTAITTPKMTKPSMKASKTTRNGRELKQQEELVDLADLEFETGYKAIEELGKA
jgi:hypothetical protein